MKNKKVWIIVGVLVIIGAVIVGITGLQKAQKQDRQVIKIAAILPLSGSAAEFGVGNKNGISLAVEEINAKGGVINQELTITYHDSQNDPKVALSEFNKILNIGKPDSLFICMSGISMTLKPMIEQNKIPAFCVAAAPDLTKESRYMFRMLPTTNYQAQALAKNLSELDAKGGRLCLLYIQDEFGESFMTSFTKMAEQVKLDVLVSSSFPKEGANFRDIITKIIDSKPNSIVIGGYGSSLGVLLKQIREAKFMGVIYGTPEMAYPKVLEIVGKDIGEAYVLDFDINYAKPKVKEFISNFKMKFGSEPSLDAFIGYECGNLIANGLKLFLDKGLLELRDGIVKISDYEGVTGNISVNTNGEIEYKLKLKKL